MKVLVFGAAGQVGSEVMDVLKATDWHAIGLTRKDCDLQNQQAIKQAIKIHKPDFIVNCAAYTAVDKAETELPLANQINHLAVEAMATYANHHDIPLLHLSTDYVFDGTKSSAYTEQDIPNPTGVYGASKLKGEQALQAKCAKHIILRVSWVFGAHGHNFVKTILKLAKDKRELGVVADQWGCPTAAKDIARVVMEVIKKYSSEHSLDWGIYHYVGYDSTNWYQFANQFITRAKKRGEILSLEHLKALRTEDYPTAAKRPKNSILDTSKIEGLGIKRHAWDDYLVEVIDSALKQEETV